MITRLASSSKSRKRVKVEEHVLDSDAEPPENETDVEDHLARAQEGVGVLLKAVKSLRWRNEILTAELQDLRDATGNTSRSSNEMLQKKVRKLKSDIRKLERAREKDKEKIQKYKANEVKQEAADLEDPADHDVGEKTHGMRKMLRRVHDLMSMNTLEKDEECPVCLETMSLKNCSSLPCQHLICNTCLPKICKVDWSIRSAEPEGEQGEEVTKCPQCREQTPRAELQLVQYTATQQWDDLLEIAQEWAKMDRRRADETSEEEGEEDFINNKSINTTSSSASSPEASRGSTPESDMAVDRAETPEATQPHANGARSYLDSPSATKRKRMKELAEQRKKKKRL